MPQDNILSLRLYGDDDDDNDDDDYDDDDDDDATPQRIFHVKT